ncbi:hypothetical protein CEF12_08800 [Enterococcus faecalis]|nr:hypothetical protein CEF12_08800 [Enterococcus faecalis]
MAIKRQSKIIRLRHRSFKKDNFWKGKRIIYEVKEVRTESFIFEAIGSVSTIYQVLSLEQKSKVIFVPGSFFKNQGYSVVRFWL